MRDFVNDNEDMFRIKIVSIKPVVNPEFNWQSGYGTPRYLFPKDGETRVHYYGPYDDEVVARTAATNGGARDGEGFISQTVQKVKNIEWEDYIAPCRTCGHTDIPVVEKVAEPPKPFDWDERVEYNPNPARWATPVRNW